MRPCPRIDRLGAIQSNSSHLVDYRQQDLHIPHSTRRKPRHYPCCCPNGFVNCLLSSYLRKCKLPSRQRRCGRYRHVVSCFSWSCPAEMWDTSKNDQSKTTKTELANKPDVAV